MSTYTMALVLLVCLCTFIEARLALKHIRISTILRLICKDLITLDFRRRGKPVNEESIEEELSRLFEKKEEEL